MIDKELPKEQYQKAVKQYLELLKDIIKKGQNGTIKNKVLNKYIKEQREHNSLFFIVNKSGGYQGGLLSYSYRKGDIELWLELRVDTGVVIVYDNMLSRFPRYMEEVNNNIWLPVDGACEYVFKREVVE
jgi:hypothetical protein